MSLVDGSTGEIVGRTLGECETVIEAGIGKMLAVGAALREIRDNRLYRGQFAAFDTYTRERWGWTRRQADRMIEAAGVVEKVRPIGLTSPQNESQARALKELADASPEAAAEVMDEVSAEAAAAGEPVTAEKISDKVRPALRALDGGRADEPEPPTLGDLVTLIPSSFAREPEFRRSNESARLGSMLDSKAIKDAERLVAMVHACPVEWRAAAASVAEDSAAAWKAAAYNLRNPMPMEATR